MSSLVTFFFDYGFEAVGARPQRTRHCVLHGARRLGGGQRSLKGNKRSLMERKRHWNTKKKIPVFLLARSGHGFRVSVSIRDSTFSEIKQ